MFRQRTQRQALCQGACATADRAQRAEHLIRADGLRGEPVYKALTHPAIQSKGKA